ncbi:2'-5' RNA ligase family protein [Flaviaesturariibacter terrae]
MDTPATALPGYRVHEYRLVVPLSDALQERVGGLRDRLHERHRVKPLFVTAPALTVLQCHAFERTEARFVERLQQLTMAMTPFKVELENFAAYPSHTIYIHVSTRTPFLDLVKELRTIKWLMNVPGQEPHFIPEPHLVLAQRLKPMQFIGMWMECEHSEFSGRFLADKLVLLRRKEGGPWQELQRLELLQQPSAFKQGSLFGS